MIEEIKYKDEILAILVSNDFSKDGITFVSPDTFSQQLAFMKHPEGKVIQPHTHNPVGRQIQYTNEVLFIKRGKLRVDFYDGHRNYLESRIIEQGDVILLATGGHGFTVLEEVEFFEVKQGPYVGEKDKTRFNPVEETQVKYKSNE